MENLEEPDGASLSGERKRARVSRWDLEAVKPDMNRFQVVADANGKLRTKISSKLTEEEWREVALKVADTHFVQADGTVNVTEREHYIKYYHNMGRFIKRYSYQKVLDFDAKVRAEIEAGTRISWNPLPIMQDWYDLNGMWTEGGGEPEPARRPGEKDRKPQPTKKTCNNYSSTKGCSRPTHGAGKCKFLHRCAKCGGTHPKHECT